MFKRTFDNASLTLVDGTMALGIICCGLIPREYRVLDLRLVHGSRIGLGEVMFASFFILTWNYCFSVLHLYNKAAAMPSRLVANVKGLVIMMTPLIAYIAFVHPSYLSLERFSLTFLALLAYEVNRVFVTGYLLDRSASRDPRRAIILGSGRRAGKAWREIRTRYHSSITFLGFLDDRDPLLMAPEVAQRYIGRVDMLEETILTQVVDVILIAMPIQSCYQIMQRVVHIAENVGVQIIYLGDIYSSATGRASNEYMFREFAPQQDRYLVRLATKRLADIILALAALLVLLPLMLVIAVGIKLTSPGPVIFCQQRYGHRRRLFAMFKFRSMVNEAEDPVPPLETLNVAEGSSIVKSWNGPRSTSFGRLLRRTSLDELPQLLNVLVGDMSLVGPRPMSVRDVSKLKDAAFMRRFSVKPGVTGLWKISSRVSLAFDDWLALDTLYIDEWSLFLDIKILVRTVGAVIKRSGAM